MTIEDPVKFIRLNLPAMTIDQLFAQPSQNDSRHIKLTPQAVDRCPQNGTFPSKRVKAVQSNKIPEQDPKKNLKKLKQSLKAIDFDNITSEKIESYEKLLKDGKKLILPELKFSSDKSIKANWHACRGMLNKLSDRLQFAKLRESTKLKNKKGPQKQETIEAKTREEPVESNNERSSTSKEELKRLRHALTSNLKVRARNFEYCQRLVETGREATSIQPSATAIQVNKIWLDCVKKIDQLTASIERFKEKHNGTSEQATTSKVKKSRKKAKKSKKNKRPLTNQKAEPNKSQSSTTKDAKNSKIPTSLDYQPVKKKRRLVKSEVGESIVVKQEPL